MISIFISYRRQDASQLADRIKKQLVPYGIDAYVDVSGVDGAGEFPQRLRKAIADAAVFVCLLGPTTLASEWVVMEIQHAFTLEKPMIPVFLQRFEKPTDVIDPAVLKLLNSDNVEMLDIKNLFIDAAIEQLATMVQKTVNKGSVAPATETPSETSAEVPLDGSNDKLLESQATGTAEKSSDGPDEKPADTPAQESAKGMELERHPAHEREGLIRNKLKIAGALLFVVLVLGVGLMAVLAERSKSLVPSLTPNQSGWTQVERDFDGVPMVLVPKGCLRMGSVTGDDDERPVHEVCLEPFWIDKTEVTQRQFREHGGVKASANAFSGDDRPVESITWFEARDFCALRGGRLPTEEEWEYAARGPNSLDYPWGDELVDAKAVFARSDESGTADVGSLPAGASWVGALDMSGNVWEWTATEYLDYAEDGYVEDGEPASSSTVVQRVLRGGSWVNTFTGYLRTSLRFWYMADHPDVDSGFRCVREYDASDQ
jgi:formylglycine-generating enzyme required for sulfatase activity